jgi:hypothetical protein
MFSDDQVGYILNIVRGIIDGVMNTGGSGVVGRAREMTAFSQYVAGAPALFGDNPLIEQLIGGLSDPSFLTDGSPFKNPSDLFDAMGDLGGGLPMDEAGTGLRQFIYGLAESVAGASGSGLFGMGKKFDDHEANFLDFLKEKLGLM